MGSQNIREENAALSHQATNLNYLVSKLKAELEEKENINAQSASANNQDLQYLRQQL
jgi:uncharacterized protein YccT (UPF0319 family)